jgi:hypothetical protein
MRQQKRSKAIKPGRHPRPGTADMETPLKNARAADEVWLGGIEATLAEWTSPEDAAAYDELTRAGTK